MPLLLAFVCARHELAAQSDTAFADGVTAAMLRQAGATRSSDVLPLFAPWQVSTIDGFTWQAAPNGGDGPFSPSAPIVLVDGRRVEAELFGRLDLDRAGVPLEHIGRVEFLELPRLVAGRITTRGVISIHTREPPPGTSAGAGYAAGTEVGDPGPFAFTPSGGENVDRLGHDVSAVAAHRSARWFASAAVAESERIPTDPAIAARYRAALGPVPRLETTSLALLARARTGAVDHRVSLRHTDEDGVLLLAPLGSEVGIRDRATEIGLAGTTSRGRGSVLCWDVAHTEGGTSPRGVGERPAVRWETGTTEARVELARPARRLSTVGLRFRRVSAESRAPLSRPTISLATAYAELSPAPAGASVPVLAAAVTAGDGDIGGAASLAHAWLLPGGSTLETVVGFERAASSEVTDIWSWTERGYRLFEEVGADIAIAGVRRGPDRFAADVRWTVRPIGRMRIAARGFFRRERRLAVEIRPATLVHGVRGELAGGTVDLEWAPGQFVVRGTYWLGATVGGDTLYHTARAAVPHHGARLASAWTPRPSLGLWLAASWRSASRWHRLDNTLGGALAVDAAVSKSFWRDRLRVQAIVRNLLGGNLRYHPEGAAFDPTVVLKVSAGHPTGS